MKVGYGYLLYYFMKFISLCKIVSSYSYTLISVQYVKRLGDYTLISKMCDFLSCKQYLCIVNIFSFSLSVSLFLSLSYMEIKQLMYNDIRQHYSFFIIHFLMLKSTISLSLSLTILHYNPPLHACNERG